MLKHSLLIPAHAVIGDYLQNFCSGRYDLIMIMVAITQIISLVNNSTAIEIATGDYTT